MSLVSNLTRTDDVSLVKKAAKGDQHAFRSLYERYQRPMSVVAFRVGGSFVDVDDVVQDVFVRAWKALPGFRQDAQFSTWLYRITVNTTLRHRERGKNERDRVSADYDGEGRDIEAGTSPTEATRQSLLDPADITIAALHSAKLLQYVELLGDKHRVVVSLHYYEGKSCDEIALILETSVGTVWSRLHYAIKKLRNLMELEQ